MTKMIKKTNPPTPITLNVSSSTDKVFADVLSSALDASLEDAEGELDAEAELDWEFDAAPAELTEPELAFELMEFAPDEVPESPEPEFELELELELEFDWELDPPL